MMIISNRGVRSMCLAGIFGAITTTAIAQLQPLLEPVGLAPRAAINSEARPASAADTDWASYNRTLTSQRYSPLTEITTGNVASLMPVCAADLGETVSFQSGILMVKNVLFATTQLSTYALDATTCQLKWKHSISYTPPPEGLNGHRGLAYANGRIFRGVDTGYLIALDAATGKQVWQTKISDIQKGETLPAAPVTWNGIVFMGQAGGDIKGVRGRMMAFRESDGEQLWNFDLVPMTGPGSETWPISTPENPRTGGATWTSYTIDPEKGLLYIPVGNAAPDFDTKARPGLNLYTNSIVILDATTGTFKEYCQLTPNDFHDFDLTATPALITTRSGKNLIVAGAKDGFVYALNSSDKTQLYKTPVTTIANLDVPFSPEQEVHFCPGKHGGIQWNGPAFDPASNNIFINSIDWCASVRLVRESPPAGETGKPWTGAVLDAQFGSPDPKEKSKGYLTALDAEDGSVRWRYQSPTPLIAGVTTTAGGLVITGDLNGNLLAFRAFDGQQLWKRNAGGPMAGGIITYAVNHKQYLAAAVGHTSKHWQTQGGHASIAVYALP